jgi:hypothetical protein
MKDPGLGSHALGARLLLFLSCTNVIREKKKKQITRLGDVVVVYDLKLFFIKNKLKYFYF